MNERAEAFLRNGLQTLRGMTCEHQPTCDEADEERGGCCNSCWASRWAVQMGDVLVKEDDTMKRRTPKQEAQAVNAFNQKNPVGTQVRYWTGMREGDGKLSKTRTKASVLSGHTAVVWVEDHPACIALSHIRPIA